MHRILILDSEKAVGFSMHDYFSMQGYEVDYARDRAEAEEYLAQHDYSVLIEDLWLSSKTNKEGLDMIQYVHERYPSTQIIVLTGRETAESEKEAWRRGASAFLVKPKSLHVIAQLIDGLLNVREAKEKGKSGRAGSS